jgi:hypothetical protein
MRQLRSTVRSWDFPTTSNNISSFREIIGYVALTLRWIVMQMRHDHRSSVESRPCTILQSQDMTVAAPTTSQLRRLYKCPQLGLCKVILRQTKFVL